MSDRLSSDRIVMSGASSDCSSPDGDARLTVDFDIEEDVEAELAEFARLSYTGDFGDAAVIFGECLSDHTSLFPVAAEYGDFLLRQEKFEYLVSFTTERVTAEFFKPKENAIFELMNVIARLHLLAGPIAGEEWLIWVKSFWSRGLIQTSFGTLEDVDEHLLDLFLRIAVIIPSKSADLIFNNIDKHFGALGDAWNEFNEHLELLFHYGRFWQAQGLLGYCLFYCSLRDRKRLLLQYCQAVESVRVSQDETRMALTYLVVTMTQLGLVAKCQDVVIQDATFPQIESEAALHDHDKSAIHSAVKNGHLGDLLLLLDQGDDPAALDSNGQTPLHLASNDGAVEIIQTLLTHGASPISKDSMGQLPLHLAAKNGHTQAVITLIRPEITVGPLGSKGRSPLSVAPQRDHLWRYLASWNARDSLGQLPLHLAAKNGHTEVVIALVDQPHTADTWDFNTRTPLYLAAQKGHLTIVKILLKHDLASCVNDLTFQGTLRTTAKLGHVEVMELLVIAAISVHSGDHQLYTEYAEDISTAADVVLTNKGKLNYTEARDSGYVE